jgi:hypothetical protein
VCNIIINLPVDVSPELLDAILVALSTSGIEGIPSTEYPGLTLIKGVCSTSVPAEPTNIPCDTAIPPPVEFDVALVPPAPTLPAFTDNIPTTGIEALASTEPLQAVAADATPADLPPATDAGITVATNVKLPNVIIKSLSLSTQVKAIYNPSLSQSALRAVNVNVGDGIASFTYGGVEYKYPVADDGTIRIVCAFTGKEETTFPINAKVEPLVGDEIEELIFGSADTEAVQPHLS